MAALGTFAVDGKEAATATLLLAFTAAIESDFLEVVWATREDGLKLCPIPSAALSSPFDLSTVAFSGLDCEGDPAIASLPTVDSRVPASVLISWGLRDQKAQPEDCATLIFSGFSPRRSFGTVFRLFDDDAE